MVCCFSSALDRRYRSNLNFQGKLKSEQNLHFVLLEFCIRPEYVELVRGEIDGLKGRLDHETICQLPILDSFIKESVRLNPLDKSRHRINHLDSMLDKN